LENVSFRYSDHADYVLKNLSMHIEAGECVAIAGPSGIGKSTLIKIMLGLIKPETGKILLDDVDIRTIGLKNYRHYMASVMQDDSLFSGTIRDNITMFDPAPDEGLLKSCALSACILQDIQNMPMGFLTLIGDMGSSLSGGQKQRVLLARALYKQPKLLFLDEATSHLDIATEMQVNQAVKNLGITRIMVAHREATLRLADRVIHIAEVQQQKPHHGTPEGRALQVAGSIQHEPSHHHVGAEGRLTRGYTHNYVNGSL
jgi:ATP-binding cassette subfamily B protein RaxB